MTGENDGQKAAGSKDYQDCNGTVSVCSTEEYRLRRVSHLAG